MEDMTTCSPEIWDREKGFDARPANKILDQPTERYVPIGVTCENCGCSGEQFSWFQRIQAGEVDGSQPEQDLYFCSILCLGYFSSDNWNDYKPETRSTTYSSP